MADEVRTFTQEEVNQLVGKARLEGKEAGRKEFEGWISPDELAKQTAGLNEQLAGLNDQIKSLEGERTDLQTKLTEKDGTIAKYEIDSVKTRIAREAGLSYEAIEFLQGDNEEAIKKSAEALKGLVGTKTNPTPPLGNPENPPAEDGVIAEFRKLNPNIKL